MSFNSFASKFGGNTQLPLLPNNTVKPTKAPSKSFIVGTAQLAWHHLHWTTFNKNKLIDCPITYVYFNSYTTLPTAPHQAKLKKWSIVSWQNSSTQRHKKAYTKSKKSLFCSTGVRTHFNLCHSLSELPVNSALVERGNAYCMYAVFTCNYDTSKEYGFIRSTVHT